MTHYGHTQIELILTPREFIPKTKLCCMGMTFRFIPHSSALCPWICTDELDPTDAWHCLKFSINVYSSLWQGTKGCSCSVLLRTSRNGALWGSAASEGLMWQWGAKTERHWVALLSHTDITLWQKLWYVCMKKLTKDYIISVKSMCSWTIHPICCCYRLFAPW